MATFFTLPLEIHYEIAGYLFPLLSPELYEPMQFSYVQRLTAEGKKEGPLVELSMEEHQTDHRLAVLRHLVIADTVSEEYDDIMNLIIAFGRGPCTNEPYNKPIGQPLRHLYTVQLCSPLAKAFIAAELLVVNTTCAFDEYASIGLLRPRLACAFSAFASAPLEARSQTFTQLEFDFWRTFFGACDEAANTVPSAVGMEGSLAKDPWIERLEGFLLYSRPCYSSKASIVTGRVGFIAALLAREERRASCEPGLSKAPRSENIIVAFDALIVRYKGFKVKSGLDQEQKPTKEDIDEALEEAKGFVLELLLSDAEV
ncbi:hypothetical protein BJ508DRAFT_42393 [Ascobolus immersus RN42]|uniref:Uncharacterized protein n=1 Tax=Ascobolus immersus RN42 TaxID=1160509 RepID=A0A3N4IJ58_ASCIM|nr:hypothetical protein BJ508DRAFT_42393 [Ascobolus immersus RN42]